MDFTFRDAFFRLLTIGEKEIQFPTIRGGVVNVWASRLRSGKRKGTKVIRVHWAQSQTTIDEAEWLAPNTSLIKHLKLAIQALLETEINNAKEEADASREMLRGLGKKYSLVFRQLEAHGFDLSTFDRRFLKRHPLDMSNPTDTAIFHLLEATRQMVLARKQGLKFSEVELEFVRTTNHFLLDLNTQDKLMRY